MLLGYLKFEANRQINLSQVLVIESFLPRP